MASDDLEDLQEKLEKVSVGLHEINAAYVEKLAWLAQLHRTGLKQQQALSGWLGLNEKIGKGSGKNVGRLKEAARQNLVECRSAVPVWIMPLSRVFESFDLATTTFDVLIIDEASQSDVMGLTAFALAKEVVVVGDHEQVTPYAIGQQIEKVQGLIDELLVDIPNKQLYDARTSIYDLARQSFGGTIRLVEHFRCVPDIIQFSNQLCYGGEIRPLREASSSQIKPALVSHRVKDGQSHNKVNQNEALEIASIIIALCRLEPYENCTIGVISMVGTDQALYIDSILRQRMPASDYKKRRILCGNAAQFQGDERDIIFLSMVDSPKDKPLFLRTRDDAKKLFNVAASRARDQLWVVHSLSAARDLKHGDLRLKLLQHAEDPSGLRPKETKKTDQFNSHFEKIIFQKLTESAYHVIPRYAVGEHKIDLVVEGSKGKRAAIQCDGDREMDTEAIQISLSHQIMLERLGWTFLRLRASEFCSKPDEAYKKLLRRLGRLEINQWKGYQNGISSGADDESSLYEDLVKKAEAIRIRWKNIPNPEDLGLGLQEEDQSS